MTAGNHLLEEVNMRKPDAAGNYRFIIEVLIFLTYAAFGMTWAACGIFLKEIMKDLHLSMSQASFISTSVSFAKIFGPALAGFLAYRIGLSRAFLIGSIFICLGILAPISPDYILLLAARFAMGVGGAMVVVYFTPLVMQWFDEKERIVINGINFVSINTGMMISLFATAPLMQLMGGSWKMTLVLYSTVSFVLAILWLILGKEKGAMYEQEKHEKREGEILDSVRDKNLWKLAFTYIGPLSLYLVLFTYFPSFYRDIFGFGKGSLASSVPAIAMCTGIPASLLGIYLARRTGLRIPFLRISGILLIPAVLGMFLVKSASLVIVSSCLTGLSLFIWASPFFTIPQELAGKDSRKAGTMMALFWSTCYFAATLNVWLVGKSIDLTGSYMYGFIYVTALCATLVFGSLFLPETGPASKVKHG